MQQDSWELCVSERLKSTGSTGRSWRDRIDRRTGRDAQLSLLMADWWVTLQSVVTHTWLSFVFFTAAVWRLASGRKLCARHSFSHTHTLTHTHTNTPLKLLLNTAVSKQAVFRCLCLNLYTHINTYTRRQQTKDTLAGCFRSATPSTPATTCLRI